MVDYANRLTPIENKIASVGLVVTEDEKSRALLRVLRDEFQITKEVIELTQQGIEYVIAQLALREMTIENGAEY